MKRLLNYIPHYHSTSRLFRGYDCLVHAVEAVCTPNAILKNGTTRREIHVEFCPDFGDAPSVYEFSYISVRNLLHFLIIQKKILKEISLTAPGKCSQLQLELDGRSQKHMCMKFD